MKRRYCKDCAFLLLFEAGGNTHPVCTATAKFKPGPLRGDVDVYGVVSAIDRNQDNDCEYFSRFGTPQSRRVKKWIIERLSNDGRSKRLAEYPRESELEVLRELRRESESEEEEDGTGYEEDDES